MTFIKRLFQVKWFQDKNSFVLTNDINKVVVITSCVIAELVDCGIQLVKLNRKINMSSTNDVMHYVNVLVVFFPERKNCLNSHSNNNKKQTLFPSIT